MSQTAIYILFTSTTFVFGVFAFWVLINGNTIFKKSIHKEEQRQILVSALAFTSLYMAIFPIFPGALEADGAVITFPSFALLVGIHLLKSVIVVLIPLICIVAFQRRMLKKGMPLKRIRLYVALIILFSLLVTVQLYGFTYWGEMTYQMFEWKFIWSFFMGAFIAAVYNLLSIMNQKRATEDAVKELKLAKLNEINARAELTALESQINPHFLYNTLNSISWLAKSDGEKASRMTQSLAELFRYNVNRNGELFATVKEEIDILRNYIMIEKYRYEDSLEVEIVADKSINSERIPKYILQLLVENAIKHGFSDDEVVSKIRVCILKTGNTVAIEVKDNGKPFPDEIIPGYGLRSTMEKLSLLYPGNHCISFESNPEKKVVIEFKNG